jgi:hypothetical protein
MRVRITQGAMLTGVALVLCLPWSARAEDPGRRIQDPALVETYRIEALAGYWAPRADIVVSSDAPGVPGTRMDLRNDLGAIDQRFPELQLTWRPGSRHRFRLQYIPIRFDSTATLPRDLLFNGVTFRAGLPVTARLDWTTYRFGYGYDFIVRRRATAGVIAEIKHTRVRAELRTAAAEEVSRQAMPVPAVGGLVRVYPAAHLALTGEATFFAVPERPDGHYGGHIADVDVAAVWSVTRQLGAQFGFRAIDINHLGEWNTAAFTLKGVYVGALVRY